MQCTLFSDNINLTLNNVASSDLYALSMLLINFESIYIIAAATERDPWFMTLTVYSGIYDSLNYLY